MSSKNDLRPSLRAAGVIIGIGLVAAADGSVHAAQRPPGSVRDGVYTTEQAQRGRDQYRKRCILCHLDRGQGREAEPIIPGQSLEREGDAEAPPVAGEPFQTKWSGRTAWDLYATMTGTMPVGAAGSLTPQQYADVLAYLFELNRFPAGSQALTPAREQLEAIAILR